MYKMKSLGQLLLDLVLFAVVFGLVMAFGLQIVLRSLGADGWWAPVLNSLCMLVAILVGTTLVFIFRQCPFSRLGLGWRGHGREFACGALFAAVLYALAFGISLLCGLVSVEGVTFYPGKLATSLFLFLLVGITEEMMVRGFVLGRMLDSGMNRFAALFFSSLLFSLMHFFNPNYAFLPFLNILLAGILLGASYIYTRNLWFPIALHWFWNWLQGPVLGYEVSGSSFGQTLLTLRLSGSDLWTGGVFGFEGSLLCTFLMIVGTGVIIRHYYSN